MNYGVDLYEPGGSIDGPSDYGGAANRRLGGVRGNGYIVNLSGWHAGDDRGKAYIKEKREAAKRAVKHLFGPGTTPLEWSLKESVTLKLELLLGGLKLPSIEEFKIQLRCLGRQHAAADRMGKQIVSEAAALRFDAVPTDLKESTQKLTERAERLISKYALKLENLFDSLVGEERQVRGRVKRPVKVVSLKLAPIAKHLLTELLSAKKYNIQRYTKRCMRCLVLLVDLPDASAIMKMNDSWLPSTDADMRPPTTLLKAILNVVEDKDFQSADDAELVEVAQYIVHSLFKPGAAGFSQSNNDFHQHPWAKRQRTVV